MNWEQVEGNWEQLKGKIREMGGKLTDDDIQVIKGKRQILSGKINEYYGKGKEATEAEIDHFVSTLSKEEGGMTHPVNNGSTLGVGSKKCC